MANIPFLSFPSFSTVTRFEHSLGVCHLAGIFADAARLSEKDKHELMLAALYHDVATPPFAHAVEEVLAALFGFDHEDKLRGLIIGDRDEVGTHRRQVFLGRSLKLHQICQSKKGRGLGLDAIRIADLAAGTPDDPLGDVICSDGIDLDNIDNVLRAASAMGISEATPKTAEHLAAGFISQDGITYIDEAVAGQVKIWQHVRSLLYDMIFASTRDFSLQTMLKRAVSLLAANGTAQALRDSDWSLTDAELIHDRLVALPETRSLARRIRLGDPYTPLALLWVSMPNATRRVAEKLKDITECAIQVYQEAIIRRLDPKSARLPPPDTLVNFYPDKRLRSPGRPFLFFGQRMPHPEPEPNHRVMLGVFTVARQKWDSRALFRFSCSLKKLFDDATVKKAVIRHRGYPSVDEEEIQ